MRLSLSALAALCAISACNSDGEQRVDRGADVTVASPMFASAEGPIVYIDAGHNNFHTADGRYAPFASLLRNDGFQVRGGSTAFDDQSLAGIDILVIANADYRQDRSVFTPEEVDAVVRHVRGGGALLLIADHTPYAGAAAPLASALGIRFEDVFAEDDGSGEFTRENGGLTDDPVLNGVSRVVTFAGSGFRIDAENARPLLRLGPGWTIQSLTETGLSAKRPADGLLQGALLEVGGGRVAVFGEAAMFTAQIVGTGPLSQRMGFNVERATQNKQLILNVLHWLSQP